MLPGKEMQEVITRTHFKHFVKINTRWSDIDAYHHVNNVLYFSFFDTAVNQYLIESGVLNPASSDIVGLVVNNQCQFFKSIKFPLIVHVGLSVIKIGNSSVQYLLGIFSSDDTHLSALGQYTHVYVDRLTNRPVTIPITIRTVLENLL